ncbi:MAG: hypothetical protein R3Y40_03135 [Eubacteriales bacterium]
MRQTRKSSLFLIELIIAILFFSLSSAVCVSLFGASHSMTEESENRNVALLEAQSIAEIYRNDKGNLSTIINMTLATEIEEGTYIYYLDESGAYVIEESTTTYCVEFTVNEEMQMLTLDIEVTPPDSEDNVIEFSTKIYLQNQVDESEGA